jgi:hypothetical protein
MVATLRIQSSLTERRRSLGVLDLRQGTARRTVSTIGVRLRLACTILDPSYML